MTDRPESKGISFLEALAKTGEINTEIGMSLVSGIENIYLDNLLLFYKEIIPEYGRLDGFFRSKNIESFSISVHAIKSMLSTIGAMKLSEEAFQLETASKKMDIIYCSQRYPYFSEKLLALYKALSYILPQEEIQEKEAGKPDYLREQVQKALFSADEYDNDTGMEAVNNLLVYDFGNKNNILLENVSIAFKAYEFDTAREILRQLNSRMV